MLQVLDVLLTILHVAIIVFNLSGWIWAGTRKIHFYSILLTAVSWFGLGFWYGFGYCPITDWQWQIKEQLGERELPDSFITYFVHRIADATFSADLLDRLTVVFFILAAVLSVYVNFIRVKS